MPGVFRQVLTVEDLRSGCQWDTYLTFAYYEGFLKFQKDVEAFLTRAVSIFPKQHNQNSPC